MQHDQSKKELAKCQAQLQKNLQITEDNNLVPKLLTTAKKVENEIGIKLGSENPEPQVQADLKVYFFFYIYLLLMIIMKNEARGR